MKIQRPSLVCLAALVAAGTVGAQELHLNEIYASHQFSDDREFIELIGTPGMSLDGYMVLMIDGESPVTDGLLDRAWDLSGLTVPQDGFFVLGDTITANVDFVMATDNILENGTETFYLVQTADPAYFTNNLGVHMDPDGDRLRFKWFVYPEAGTYARDIPIRNARGINPSLVVPDDAMGKSIHVVLQATDDGEPALTRYRRVVIDCSSVLGEVKLPAFCGLK